MRKLSGVHHDLPVGLHNEMTRDLPESPRHLFISPNALDDDRDHDYDHDSIGSEPWTKSGKYPVAMARWRRDVT